MQPTLVAKRTDLIALCNVLLICVNQTCVRHVKQFANLQHQSAMMEAFFVKQPIALGNAKLQQIVLFLNAN
jgi:hypothetical protein